MAIKTDATASSASTPFSHTCTGNNVLLCVSIYSTSDTVTAVTYNGVAMALLAKDSYAPVGNTGYFYYLLNPTTGANNVAITGAFLTASSTSYAGIRALDTSATSKLSNSSTLTVTLTTNFTNCWTLLAGFGVNGSVAASTGSTLRNAGTTSNMKFFDSNGPLTKASHSMTFTDASGAGVGGIMASFIPTVGNFLAL